MNILYEDKDIIVLVKPFGVASQMERGSAEDMVSLLMNYFHKNGEKNPYVGVVHRLDKNVSGVMVYGKNKKATAGLSKIITDASTEKYYVAEVYNGDKLKDEDRLTDYLIKDGRLNMSRVAEKDELLSVRDDNKGNSSNLVKGSRAKGDKKMSVEVSPKKAELVYRKKETRTVDGREITTLDIRLLTGRHHQIRVQFSSRGCPLVGDRKYGADLQNPIKCRWVALYCYRMRFRHPVTGKQMDFEIQPPCCHE